MEQFYYWALDIAYFIRENPLKLACCFYLGLGVANIMKYLDILYMAINEPIVIKKMAEIKNAKIILNIVLVVGLIFMILVYPATNIFFSFTNFFRRK